MFHFDPFTFRFGRLTRLGDSISASFLVLFSFLSVALSSSEYGPAVLASRQARVSAHVAPSQARSYVWCAGVLNRNKPFRLVDTSEHHRPGLTASSLEMDPQRRSRDSRFGGHREWRRTGCCRRRRCPGDAGIGGPGLAIFEQE